MFEAAETPAEEQAPRKHWMKGFLEFAATMSGYFDLNLQSPGSAGYSG